jgi:hypothetical protein
MTSVKRGGIMRSAFSAAVLFAVACFVLSIGGECATAPSEKSGVASADTAKAQKKRVRKETAPPPPGGKAEIPPRADEEEDSSSSFFESCLGDLFGAVLGSICGGSSSESNEAEQPVQDKRLSGGAGPQIVYHEGGVRQGLPFFGTVTTIDMREDSVEVWDRPGGDAADGAIIRTLAKGADVKATEFEFYQTELWMRIETAEPGALSGWLRDKEIIPFAVEPPAAQTAGAEELQGAEPPGQHREEALDTRYQDGPRWYVRGEASYPAFENEAIREEYREKSWATGFEAGFFLTRSINVGVLFGYLHGDGTPQYEYKSPTSTWRDWPLVSDLDILSFGAQGGQLLVIGNNGTAYFMYGIGPAVFSVREKASIAVYEGNIRKDTRIDKLSEWKFGAEAKIEGGLVAAGRIPIGGFVRFSWIPWKSNSEKSLTLDYLDSSSISVFNIGISVGYLFF